MSGRGRPVAPVAMKRGHLIAKDLKAVEGLVPQLKKGYVKWSNGMRDAAVVGSPHGHYTRL